MSNYNPYTKRQTMIAPDYEVYRYRSTYMNEVELHHHDFYEVYLLLRGRVEYIVENQLYRVRPGDWMICSPRSCSFEVLCDIITDSFPGRCRACMTRFWAAFSRLRPASAFRCWMKSSLRTC